MSLILIVAAIAIAPVVSRSWRTRHAADLPVLLRHMPAGSDALLYFEDSRETHCSLLDTDCAGANLLHAYLVDCDVVAATRASFVQQLNASGFRDVPHMAVGAGLEEEWRAGPVADDVTGGHVWAELGVTKGDAFPSTMNNVSAQHIAQGCTLAVRLYVDQP